MPSDASGGRCGARASSSSSLETARTAGSRAFGRPTARSASSSTSSSSPPSKEAAVASASTTSKTWSVPIAGFTSNRLCAAHARASASEPTCTTRSRSPRSGWITVTTSPPLRTKRTLSSSIPSGFSSGQSSWIGSPRNASRRAEAATWSAGESCRYAASSPWWVATCGISISRSTRSSSLSARPRSAFSASSAARSTARSSLRSVVSGRSNGPGGGGRPGVYRFQYQRTSR